MNPLPDQYEYECLCNQNYSQATSDGTNWDMKAYNYEIIDLVCLPAGVCGIAYRWSSKGAWSTCADCTPVPSSGWQVCLATGEPGV